MYRDYFLPVLPLILGAAVVGLVLSCGSSSSSNNNCTSSVNGQIVGVPCTTTVPPLRPHLVSIDVCSGPPAGPTAVPSVTPTGKASPTPTHTPCATATTAMIPDPVELNAAGFFKHGGQTFFRDITSGSGWFSDNTNLSYNSNGQFTTVNPGCTCVYASNGGIVSGPMGVAIGPNGGSPPVCTPCPIVATPTPKPALGDAPGLPARTGRVMWRFDAHSAVEGRVVAAPSGAAVYFITADRLLHAIDTAGRQLFVRSAGGASPVVAANGTVYAEGAGGGLMALDPGGKLRWFVETGRGMGPLAAGPDNTVYDAAGGELLAIDGSGSTKWRMSMAGVRQVVIAPEGGIVTVSDGGLMALSADGAIQWTAAPPGGIAGDVAILDGTLLARSPDGTLQGLDLADGSELWQRRPTGGVNTGVATDGSAAVYVADRAALSAFDVNGAPLWSSGGFVPEAVSPAVSSHGTVFVAAQGGHLAAVGSDGKLRWIAGDFGQIDSMTFSSSGTLYVLSSDGICWALEEIADTNQPD
jgi:outer membrane protein assembly factor BamB